MANREDFDPQTLAALDQVATLLKLTRDLRSMEATFRNSPELSGREGKPCADTVTGFATKSGGRLLKAAFANDKKRARQIASAQKAAAKDVPRAIAAAEVLAEMERTAMTNAGAKGNVIETLVVRPLQDLGQMWSTH